MNDFYEFWVDTLGFVNIGILLIAGFLIISRKKSIKFVALGLYLIHNLFIFVRGYVCDISSYITGALIFGTLTLINIIRVVRQKEEENE